MISLYHLKWFLLIILSFVSYSYCKYEAKKINQYSNNSIKYTSKLKEQQQQQYFSNQEKDHDVTKINTFINDDVNDNSEYGKTDFINIKRNFKKLDENKSMPKPLMKKESTINQNIHHYDISTEKKQDIKVQKLIYKSKLLKQKEAHDNKRINKRKLDNFIIDNTLYYNQYFGSQLNDIEKYIYDILVAQLKGVTLLSFLINIDFENEYSVRTKDIVNIIERVFGALSMDHPDIWWITKYRIHFKTKNSDSSSQPLNNDSKSNSEIEIENYNSIQKIDSKGDNDSFNTTIHDEIGRRIKIKRNHLKGKESLEDSRFLSKIQIQLCSSPLNNVCNTYSVNDINRMNNLIEKKIQLILSNAKIYFQQQQQDYEDDELSYDSIKIYEYDFIKYLHDILIKNIQYGFSDNGFTEYTIYGALVEHRCVCEGFSEAFMILAQRAKIYTILATSNTHQWNMVFLEGKWYALDITWDIPNYSIDVTPDEYNQQKIFNTRKDNNDNMDKDNNDNMDKEFHNDNNTLFDKTNTAFFLVGSKTIVNNKTHMIFKKEPNHQLCDYVIYQYALGFRYPKLDNNKYNPQSLYKKYIHIYY